MTASIRYVQNTIAPSAATIPVGSTGKDCQLLVFDIVCTGGIAANTNANILQWTGSGKIFSVMSFLVLDANATPGSIYVPVNADSTNVTIDATGKIINVAIANNGTPITANSTIKMILVIGTY